MSQVLRHHRIDDNAVVHETLAAALAPKIEPASKATQPETDRSFEMPTGLYGATVAFYISFVAITGIGFYTPGLAIPIAIFALFIVAGFGVPALWVRMNPQNGSRALTMSRFADMGIETHTGRVSARDASVQMLILPVLIVMWGTAAVAIAASV